MKIESTIGNLGDNLWLIPLFLNGVGTKLVMIDNPRCREIGKIFDNICPVEYSSPSDHCTVSNDRIHRAAGHLKYFGSTGSCIPKIIFTLDEIHNGNKILYGIKNPVAINFTTMNKGADWCSSRRVMTKEQSLFTVSELIKAGYTPVNLGLSSNTEEIDGVINILDLCIRETAICYALIGKYIGTESGTSNLMIAAGGKALIYHPDHCDISYPAWKYHFTEEYWTDQKCRAKYVNFKEIQNLNEDMKFLLT